MLYFWFMFEGEEETPVAPTGFTQEQVNAFNKAERLKREAAENKLKETETLLNSLRNEKNLNESEKEELRLKLEEIEKAKMTDAEKRQHELDKIKNAYEAEKNELLGKLSETVKGRNDLIITRAITEAAMGGDIVAADNTGNQLIAILKHQAEVNDEGEAIIKNFTYTDEGKSFTEEQMPLKDAISKMKNMEAWANLWKDPKKPGYVNHITGHQPNNVDYSKLSQEEYSKLRAAGKIPWAATKGR